LESEDDNSRKGKYENLRFTGIGGPSGMSEIWEDSLLYKIKHASRHAGEIKMAIGITMYNEDWHLVTRTLKGIAQGIVDIYNDEVEIWAKSDKAQKPDWKRFRDQFLIVLIADGYRELTAKKDPNDKDIPIFHTTASKLDIFDDSIIKKTFFNQEKDKPTTLMSMEEIASKAIRLYPETVNLDAEAFEEIERFKQKNNPNIGSTP
jgi:hypothetical protein